MMKVKMRTELAETMVEWMRVTERWIREARGWTEKVMGRWITNKWTCGSAVI